MIFGHSKAMLAPAWLQLGHLGEYEGSLDGERLMPKSVVRFGRVGGSVRGSLGFA